jgi:hypothetical protein
VSRGSSAGRIGLHVNYQRREFKRVNEKFEDTEGCVALLKGAAQK